MNESEPVADPVGALSALTDPVRRALLVHVSRQQSPVSRDEAARAFGLARSTAAFHLDRLADEGLLAVEYKRLSGRTGPGAGRPSKLYARAATEVAVTVPERRYDLAAQILLTGIEESARTGEPVQDVLPRAAFERGRAVGADATSLEEALESHGFEPRQDGGDVVLGNCPFHRLAADHTETVCGLNLALLRGVTEGVSADGRAPVLDPATGRCCVRITRAA